MARLTFLPTRTAIEVDRDTKILVAARRAKVDIKFGCASCRCGTCGVQVSGGLLSAMKEEEAKLLDAIGLPVDGTVRLACQARMLDGETEVDLTFQLKYDPDQRADSLGDDDDNDDEDDD